MKMGKGGYFKSRTQRKANNYFLEYCLLVLLLLIFIALAVPLSHKKYMLFQAPRSILSPFKLELYCDDTES